MAGLLKFGRDMRKELEKRVAREIKANADCGTNYDEKEIYQHNKERLLAEIKNDCLLALEIRSILEETGMMSKQSTKISGNWMWITLRPADEHKHRFADFRNLVENTYLNRAMFLDKIWVWEQKGETPETIGKGYHVHILANMRKGLMKTQAIKDTKSTFNKWLNGEVPDAFVEIEYVRSEDHYNNICAYIQGYKKDDWKEPACILDPEWRTSKGLKNIYGDINILSSKSEG